MPCVVESINIHECVVCSGRLLVTLTGVPFLPGQSSQSARYTSTGWVSQYFSHSLTVNQLVKLKLQSFPLVEEQEHGTFLITINQSRGGQKQTIQNFVIWLFSESWQFRQASKSFVFHLTEQRIQCEEVLQLRDALLGRVGRYIIQFGTQYVLATLLKAGDQLNWNRLQYNVITSTDHIQKKFHYHKFWQKVLKSWKSEQRTILQEIFRLKNECGHKV